jgi:ABC-2 type transport system ATP-binding protein
MIQVRGLSKRYGRVAAVDDVSFEARPGTVTGFLGPNGAGKSSTMRIILGLDRPDRGQALIDGRPYRSLSQPLREVGAMLDARAAHPGMRGREHLLAIARSDGIGRRRVEQVAEQTGIAPALGRRIGGYSLGMRQRLGVAAALLGDPAVLIFDEPANGLDPEGIRWLRRLLRGFADEGRTVFLSSHLIGEIAQIADRVVVIARGRVLRNAAVGELSANDATLIRTPDTPSLLRLLEQHGTTAHSTEDGAVLVEGLDAAQIGLAAFRAGIPLTELTPRRTSLEDAFMSLTTGQADYYTSPMEVNG